MPLFRRHSVNPSATTPTPHSTTVVEDPAPRRSSGLFGTRRRSVQPHDQNTPSSSSTRHLFSKRDTLSQAQAKLRTAQEHEAAADRALVQSRRSVTEAKAEIALLEREAKEEEKRAKLHVTQAGKIRREGDKLGRHL